MTCMTLQLKCFTCFLLLKLSKFKVLNLNFFLPFRRQKGCSIRTFCRQDLSSIRLSSRSVAMCVQVPGYRLVSGIQDQSRRKVHFGSGLLRWRWLLDTKSLWWHTTLTVLIVGWLVSMSAIFCFGNVLSFINMRCKCEGNNGNGRGCIPQI